MCWTTAALIMLDCLLAYGMYTVVVTEGDTVHLECRTTVRSLVDWKKQLDPRAPGTYIVVATRLMPTYKPRFEFDNSTYALAIHNVTGNDSGLYYCIEDKGAGQQHFVQLNVDIVECTSSPCLNGGTCIDGQNEYMCSCQSGYTGVNCQSDINECNSLPCLNNGTCINGLDQYVCICHTGYTGVNCQTDDIFMTTSHVILIGIAVSLAIAVAAVVIFGVVKHLTRKLTIPEMNITSCELDEIIPLVPLQANELAFEIKRLSEELKEMIEPDYGLLDELIGLGVLTHREYSELRTDEQTVYRRLDRLLDLLTSKKSEEQCRNFILVLHRTDQLHVVNYIQQHGVIEERFDDVRPLDHDQLQHLSVNRPSLVKVIDSNDTFLTDLVVSGCITQEHISSLRTIKDQQEKNRKLLDILRRRSVAHLKKFIVCLANNKQTGLSELVLNGEVNMEPTSPSLEDGDDETKFKEQELTQARQIIEVNMEPTSPSSDDGDDETKVQEQELMEDRQIREFTTFAKTEDRNEILPCSPWTHFPVMPLEIREIILMTAAIVRRRWDETSRSDYIARLITLNSVCSDWWFIMTSRPYMRRQLRQYIKFQLAKSYSSNIGARRAELREMIEPDYGLLDELVKLEIVSAEQRDDINKQQTVEQRNDKLLECLEKMNEYHCVTFLRALKDTSQQHVVNLICIMLDDEDIEAKLLDYGRELEDKLEEEFGDIRPLTSQQLSVLDVNRSSLVELIDLQQSLMEQLESTECITSKQRQATEQRLTIKDKNSSLLDILRRRSLREFKQFVQELHGYGQQHLASVITDAQVIVGIDLEIATGDEREADHSVRPLQLCTSTNTQKIQSEMSKHLSCDVILISLLIGSVIRAHFHCKTVMGLHRVDELCITGQLATILQQVIVGVTAISQQFSISRVVWRAADYIRCTRYFHEQQGLLSEIYRLCPYKDVKIKNGFNVSEQFLPIEMIRILDDIMIKTAGLFLRVFHKLGSIVSDAVSLTILSSVCRGWWMIVASRHLKTHLHKHFDYVCRPYRSRPQLVKKFNTKNDVYGVTLLDDKMFVVSLGFDTIQVFGLNYEQLEDITVNGLEHSLDIVACSETRSLYVVDFGRRSQGCVWRVSMDGRAKKFLPITTTSLLSSCFSPLSLSVTSGRLLVLTVDDELLLYGANGVELKRLSFTYMSELHHALETPHGTFVICHREPQPQVVEVDGDGRIISVYYNHQQLAEPCYLSLDSDGMIFVADYMRHHILLLTSDLKLDRVMLDMKDSEHDELVELPCRLFYIQQTLQLLVADDQSPFIQIFALG